MISGRIHSLVVGGTRGHGKTLVRRFAKAGHVVSVIGTRAVRPDERVSGPVHYCTVDITHRKRLAATLAKIIREQGKLNNLVFFQRFRGKGQDWSGEIETTLTGTRDTIDLLAGHFKPGAANAIVAVSSIASFAIADEQPLSYHMAKAALVQMMRFYAVKLAPKGIRVNSVSPCTILRDVPGKSSSKNKKLSDLIKKAVPLGRLGSSEDLAGTIQFLCGSDALFLTGQDLVLDGGLSLRWPESLLKHLVFSGKRS